MNLGFALGGAAEGLKTAADIRQADEGLGLKRELGLGELALRSRGLDQEKDLRTRALDLQQQSQKNAQSRALLAQADKQVSDTLGIVSETITSGIAAGRDPAVVAKAIQPLVESAKRVARAGGLDSGAIDVKVNTWMAQPSATETAVGQARTKIQAANTVATETGVPQREAMQGQGLLRAEPKGDTTVETIRGKIAGGETLTTGEQKVYDDALRADPFAHFLALMQGVGGGATAPAPASPAAPAAAGAAAAPVSVTTPAEAQKLKPGTRYQTPNGQIRIR